VRLGQNLFANNVNSPTHLAQREKEDEEEEVVPRLVSTTTSSHEERMAWLYEN